MQIDNAYVEVEGPELPILDGSAAPWVEAIEEAGVVATDALRRVGRLEQCVVLREGESWMLARPADGFTITCAAHFDHPLLGTRAFTFAGAGEEYAREIAPARTFGFIEEVEALRAAGRALGGTLDNALVIYRDHFSGPLRLPDEWLRHKALDLVGDLALVGAALQADITAIRPGHRTNVAFASLLAQSMTMDDGAANTQA